MKLLENEASPLVKNSNSHTQHYKYVIVVSLVIVMLLSLTYSPVSINNLLTNIKAQENNMNNHNELSPSHITGTDPFTNYAECNSEDMPTINGYHVHGVFDGDSQDSINVALNAYHSFIEYVNPDMEECTFSHSNSGEFQTEICYFPSPYEETDFPISSNVIFSSANYAFYVPKTWLQKTIEWWMQHHYSISEDISFDYIIHPVSGCQTNDHTLWFMNSKDYDYQIVAENLLCCHSGPSKCTCELASYKATIDGNEQCLTAFFVDSTSNGHVTLSDCESDDDPRNLGTWRENTYSENNEWLQIENFGDVISPIYVCLTVMTDKNSNEICSVGNKIELADCSIDQDTDNNEWVSKRTRFQWDTQNNQIKFLGCDENVQDLCVDLKLNSDNKLQYLYLQTCSDAIVFERTYFP